MQATFRTIRYPQATYLIIEDSEGAEASLLMREGELLSECLNRHIADEQNKRAIHESRANRMRDWLANIIIGQRGQAYR